MAAALWRFWSDRGWLTEGHDRFEEFLPASPAMAGDPTVRIRALYGAGVLAEGLSRYSHATARYTESLAVAREIDDTRGMANALNGLARVANEEGN